MAFADLAADTAVRPDPEVAGRYHLALPGHWDFLLPSGGVVMTCALRAAAAAIGDPQLRLASATTTFCTPFHPGALVADVELLRRGGATAQLRVAMRHAQPPPGARPSDNIGLALTATFVRERSGPDVTAVQMPAVRAVADARSVDDGAATNPHARFRFYHQLECRIADGEPTWLPDAPAGPARYARWFRYRTPQRGADGLLDRLALPPLLDTMPSALQRAIGGGGYRFFAPSLDLTTYVVDDTDREWLLVATTLRRARAGWAVADAEVWDDTGRLIAHGSQAMFIQGVAGEPPRIDAARR